MPQPELEVRLAHQADLPAIADGMNRYYCEHNLWSPVSAASLEAFLEQDAAGVKPNQLYVVARGGEPLAGLSTSDRTALVHMRITRAPWFLRLLGAWLGVLPRSGVLRALTVRRLWFEAGELDSARYLWQSLRYRLRSQADGLGIAYDLRDRLADVFRLPAWLPTFPARYVVRVEGKLETGRLTYCIAGP
jgi:hypothetical protein